MTFCLVINIGFFSSTPVNRSNTREVRLGKISGDMQSDIEVKVELRLEFITTGILVFPAMESFLFM